MGKNRDDVVLEEEAWKTKADKAVTATDRLICITQELGARSKFLKISTGCFQDGFAGSGGEGGKASLAPPTGNFHTIPEYQGSSLQPLLFLPFP